MNTNNYFKRHISACIFSLTCCSSFFAQELIDVTNYDHPVEHDATHPCISESEYSLIESRCAANHALLQSKPADHFVEKADLNTLIWPLEASVDLHDCSFYRVSAYVDEDQTAGVIQDYNCGTRTYDGHRGTDISTWPFNFYKMDNDLVKVIAAAPGTIIDKHDGEFDRNCSGNNLTANYVIIEHADGSRALYWHMKNTSITTKAIGETVLAGEYLGVVGSSGSSSGPHLHFEVWNGSSVANRIDPFAGGCNSLNANSWWANQKVYKETAIVKASVHTTDIVLPPCPETETLNESNSYAIPFQGPGLPAGYAKFYIFIREEINGMNADLKILNPDGTTYLSWTYASTSDNAIRTWGWSKVLPVNPGTYTFQATYNGQTCSSEFIIQGPVGIAENNQDSGFNLYPNPSKGSFFVSHQHPLNQGKIVFFNVLGEEIYRETLEAETTEINLQNPQGVYFYKVIDGDQTVYSGKLLIE